MSWVKFFTSNTSDYEGYVESEEQLHSLVEAYEVETNAHYVKIRSRDKYKINIDEIDYTTMKLCWADMKSKHEVIVPRISDDLVPFIQLGSCSFECHQGSSRKLKNIKKENRISKDEKQRTKKPVTSKKLGCPSMIRVRRVQKFIEYKVANVKNSKIILSFLREKLLDEKTRGEVKIENRFYVHIPLSTSHKNHIVGEEAAGKKPEVHNGIIDKRLSAFIQNKIIKENISSTKEMLSLVHEYVQLSLFKDKPIPPSSNTRYWPSLTQIRNQMITFNIKRRNTALNDEELENLSDALRRENPDDNIRLRLKSSCKKRKDKAMDLSEATDYSDIPGKKCKFLFVYQKPWQRRLLTLYGDEICILEVYRPTKYAVPLFFIVIPTNCIFTIVACFIVESEAQVDIEEGLSIVKSWNPSWNPKCFMTDFSEAEMAAVESVFKGTRTELFFCDYHRLYNWNRWLSNETMKIAAFKDEIWKNIANVAESYSEALYQENLQALRSSEGWKSSPCLQRWFEKWITNAARWVKLYRQDKFIIIDTNSGMEGVNSIIKQMFLSGFSHEKMQTVNELAEITITRFLPCLHSKYCQTNIKWNDNALHYNLPFLNNRPAFFVEQVIQRWEDSQALLLNHVFVQDSFGTFHIMGSASRVSYEIMLENGYGLPSCGCVDWLTNHYPCIHILAGISAGSFAWEDLAITYRDSPFLNLDFHCINNERQEGSERIGVDNCQMYEAEEFRSYLKKLEELSYMSYNKEVFQKINSSLQRYITDLTNTCPTDHINKRENEHVEKSFTPQEKIDSPKKAAKRKEIEMEAITGQEIVFTSPTKIKFFVKNENQNVYPTTLLNL